MSLKRSFLRWSAPIFLQTVYTFLLGHFSFFSSSFLIPDISFHCQDDHDDNHTTPTSDQCSVRINGTVSACTAWTYNASVYGHTITEEWNLVCGKEYLKGVIQTAIVGSYAAGECLFGFYSDRFGRRKSLICGIFVCFVGNVLTTASINPYMYTAARCLLSFGSGALDLIPLFTELATPSERYIIIFVTVYSALSGSLVLPLVTWLIQDWRIVHGAYTILPVLSFINSFFVYESPRWLLSKGRRQEAEKILTSVYRRTSENNAESLNDLVAEFTPQGHSNTLKLDAFHIEALMILTLVAFTVGLADFLTVLGFTKLGGNPYSDFAIQTSIQFVPSTLVILSTKFLPRKGVLRLSFFVLMCFCVLQAVLGKSIYVFNMVSSAFVKFCIALVEYTCFIYCPEVYPTAFRATGNKLFNAFLMVGGAVQPVLTASLKPWGFAMPSLCASLSLLCLVLTLRFKETFKKPLLT